MQSEYPLSVLIVVPPWPGPVPQNPEPTTPTGPPRPAAAAAATLSRYQGYIWRKLHVRILARRAPPPHATYFTTRESFSCRDNSVQPREMRAHLRKTQFSRAVFFPPSRYLLLFVLFCFSSLFTLQQHDHHDDDDDDTLRRRRVSLQRACGAISRRISRAALAHNVRGKQQIIRIRGQTTRSHPWMS